MWESISHQEDLAPLSGTLTAQHPWFSLIRWQPRTILGHCQGFSNCFYVKSKFAFVFNFLFSLWEKRCDSQSNFSNVRVFRSWMSSSLRQRNRKHRYIRWGKKAGSQSEHNLRSISPVMNGVPCSKTWQYYEMKNSSESPRGKFRALFIVVSQERAVILPSPLCHFLPRDSPRDQSAIVSRKATWIWE